MTKNKWRAAMNVDPETVFDELLALADPKVDGRRSPVRFAKERVTRARNRAARMAAALERIDMERRMKALAAMTPGEWEGWCDIKAAAGVHERYGAAVQITRLLHAGLIKRARNAAYDGNRFGPEPQWLYRLTPAGEAKKAELVLLG